MADYIERQAALELAMAYAPDDDGSCSKAGEDIRNLLDELESIPPADVRPVVRAEWIKPDDDEMYCSACHLGMELFTPGLFFRFCPFCGAQMGGDAE